MRSIRKGHRFRKTEMHVRPPPCGIGESNFLPLSSMFSTIGGLMQLLYNTWIVCRCKHQRAKKNSEFSFFSDSKWFQSDSPFELVEFVGRKAFSAKNSNTGPVPRNSKMSEVPRSLQMFVFM